MAQQRHGAVRMLLHQAVGTAKYILRQSVSMARRHHHCNAKPYNKIQNSNHNRSFKTSRSKPFVNATEAFRKAKAYKQKTRQATLTQEYQAQEPTVCGRYKCATTARQALKLLDTGLPRTDIAIEVLLLRGKL